MINEVINGKGIQLLREEGVEMTTEELNKIAIDGLRNEIDKMGKYIAELVGVAQAEAEAALLNMIVDCIEHYDKIKDITKKEPVMQPLISLIYSIMLACIRNPLLIAPIQVKEMELVKEFSKMSPLKMTETSDEALEKVNKLLKNS